jgi:glycosyltransferase involved in cell wall biosynthesis
MRGEGAVIDDLRPTATSASERSEGMKKLFIYRNVLLPLSETFVFAQAGALRGFDAKYVGLKPVPDGLPVQNRSIVLTPDDSWTSKLRRYVFMFSGYGPAFLKRLKAEKPELIHAHFSLDGSFALPLASALNVPLVCSLHGYDVTTRDEFIAKSLPGRIYLRRRKLLWKRVSKFVPTSQYIRDRAVAAGFPAEKMEVVYSGLDLKKFSVSDEPRNRNLILYVGRLVEKKGGPYLLKAVAKVAQTNPDVELMIIGDGPLRESMEQEAKELNLNCRFMGKLMNPEPGNSVHDWMRRARVFCGPSVEASDGNTEGVPFVFVESHALGLPAVSFDHAGIKEAVIHGETGLLAPERDIDTLAEYLLRMLNDDAFWQRCSDRGRSWVWERFDLNTLTRQLENLYSSVIAAGVSKV